MDKINDFFKQENIEYFAVLPSCDAKIINMSRANEIDGFESVIIFVIPYKTSVSPNRNIARFAAPKDYHLYAKQLFERFKKICPDSKCYCDNSPIDEKRLALQAGLGIVGDNSLVINSKYGSYIFLGEIFIKRGFEKYSDSGSIGHCISCGKCKKACPVDLCFENCISAVNQTKNISQQQKEIIRNSQYKWGCDLCQEVCPYNISAQDTPIDFFKNDICDTLTVRDLDQMLSDGSFQQRAYAWRGEKTIRRNLLL